MMGSKKLSTIRKELRDALSSSTGQDPIEWLEQQMTSDAKSSAAKHSDVLASLKHVLGSGEPRRKRKSRAKT